MPDADQLIVEREKIDGYLLNATHRYGASKARFFGEFGLRAENWERWHKPCANTGSATKSPK